MTFSDRSILRVVSIVLTMVLIGLAGCRSRGQKQQARSPQQRATPTYIAFKANQSVIAVGDQARHFVTAAGAGLTIWSSAGERLVTRAALVSPGQPGAWIGLSGDGKLLAEASSKILRVVRVDQDEISWTVELRGMLTQLWGPPVFSPDQTLLALPLQGRVTLLDATSGEVRRHIGHTDNFMKGGLGRVPVTPRQGITLARQLRFSPDGRRVAISCEVSGASPSNHIVFVAAIASGEITAELRGHAGGARTLAFLDDGGILTLDHSSVLRVFNTEGALRWQLAIPDTLSVQHALVRGALEELSLAADQGRVLGWRPGSVELFEEAARSGRQIAWIGPTVDPAHNAVLFEDGELSLIPRATKPSGEAVAAPRDLAASPALMHAQAALWQIADQHHEQAITALAPFGGSSQTPMLGAAHLYASWLASDQSTPLTAALDAAGAAAWIDAGLVELVELYTSTSLLHHATELYLAWLARVGDREGARKENDRGRALGLSLADAYGSGGSSEIQRRLLGPLHRLWPQDLQVGAAYAEALRDERPEEAEEIAWSLTRRYPRELESWGLLVDLLTDYRPDKLSGALRGARAALDPKASGTWSFLAEVYQRQGLRDQALAALRKASALAPGNQALKLRLARLEKAAPR